MSDRWAASSGRDACGAEASTWVIRTWRSRRHRHDARTPRARRRRRGGRRSRGRGRRRSRGPAFSGRPVIRSRRRIRLVGCRTRRPGVRPLTAVPSRSPTRHPNAPIRSGAVPNPSHRPGSRPASTKEYTDAILVTQHPHRPRRLLDRRRRDARARRLQLGRRRQRERRTDHVRVGRADRGGHGDGPRRRPRRPRLRRLRRAGARRRRLGRRHVDRPGRRRRLEQPAADDARRPRCRAS